MSANTATLPDMQRWMMEALIAPGSVDAPNLDATFKPGAHIDAAACLGIYQRSYILRLRKCLIEQFPATAHALGEDLFCDFADEYLRTCPSDSYTLYELGRRFAAWIDENRPDRDLPVDERERWIDFMIDLASYERALFHLFDAPGHEGRAWPTGDEADDELVLLPSLVLAHSRFPVAWYYHEVRAGKAPGHPPPAQEFLAVARRDFQTSTYPLSPFHYRFLYAVRQHGNIGAALEELAGWSGRPLADVERSWRDDVRQGWIDAGFFVHRDTVG
ncbi:putative DNA-binding domain-containing protein [Kordiimonas lipolytica]|uniref:DNA-binding domain-containing protein n=1 Tax=Kordiimonas lipolytica TaxID=1662421 RepID=A0ABV8UCS3_9PROT|nr:DNA-binding domain-containing protein [Kordiimonas lipolytica]